MHLILNGELLEEVDFVLSTWGRKWQLIEDVKGIWYNEGYRKVRCAIEDWG